MTKRELLEGFHRLAVEAQAAGCPDLAQSLCHLGTACAMNRDAEARAALEPIANAAMVRCRRHDAGPGAAGRVM